MDSSSPNLVEYGTTSLYCKMENFVGWKFELPILCISVYSSCIVAYIFAELQLC